MRAPRSCKVWVELNRSRDLPLRAREVPIAPEFNVSQNFVNLACFVVSLHGFQRCGLCLPAEFIGNRSIGAGYRIAIGQARIRRSPGWVFSDRDFKVLTRFWSARRPQLLPKIAALQVSLVGCGIDGAGARQACLLLGRESDLNAVRYRPRNIIL